MAWLANYRCHLSALGNNTTGTHSTTNDLFIRVVGVTMTWIRIAGLCITLTSQWEQWRLKSPVSPILLLNNVFRLRSKNASNSVSLAFVRGIHRWPVTRKMFSFDDVRMGCLNLIVEFTCCAVFVRGLFRNRWKYLFSANFKSGSNKPRFNLI